MGLRVIRDERQRVVLDSLGIATITEDAAEVQHAREVAHMLAKDLGNDELVPPEQAHTWGGTYTRTEREVTVRRAEALLVEAYRQFLPQEAKALRIRCSTGLTDLYVTTEHGESDLLEAKSSARHFYVRQALGQILDYIHCISSPVTTLSALFPEPPASADRDLLHRYGVDCVYRTGPRTFARDAAPQDRKSVWK
jgi:hypothetical protein